MDSKTITCTAAAVTLGVALGLSASAYSSNMYTVPSSVQTATTGAVRPAVLPAQYSQMARSTAGPMRAVDRQQEEVQSSTQSSSNWLLGGLLSISAAAGTFMWAAQRRASSTYQSIAEDPEAALGNAGRALGAVALSGALVGQANAASLTFPEIQSLSYSEIKGTGLAGACPIVASSGEKLNLKAGKYAVTNMCLEPSTFQIKAPVSETVPNPQYTKVKLLTRLTYTLDGIRANLNVDGSGNWKMQELDGIDYAATSVKLPGGPGLQKEGGTQGEYVPFLFTVRNFDLNGNEEKLIGNFDVPSYRGGTFMDPKGRGGSTGYDTAVALPASGDDSQYTKENLKKVPVAERAGTIGLKVTNVDAVTGELAGVFESIQPTDDDMGAKKPKTLKSSGVWYAQISPA